MGRCFQYKPIWRRMLCLLLCCVSLLSFVPTVWAAEPRSDAVEISSGSLNVRSEPGGNVVGTLAKVESVTVTGEQAD